MEKLVSEIFLKKLKLSISQDQQPEHLCSLFLLYVQINDYLCQGDLKKKKEVSPMDAILNQGPKLKQLQ